MFESAQGLIVTRELRYLEAAQACPGFPSEYYMRHQLTFGNHRLFLEKPLNSVFDRRGSGDSLLAGKPCILREGIRLVRMVEM